MENIPKEKGVTLKVTTKVVAVVRDSYDEPCSVEIQDKCLLVDNSYVISGLEGIAALGHAIEALLEEHNKGK